MVVAISRGVAVSTVRTGASKIFMQDDTHGKRPKVFQASLARLLGLTSHVDEDSVLLVHALTVKKMFPMHPSGPHNQRLLNDCTQKFSLEPGLFAGTDNSIPNQTLEPDTSIMSRYRRDT